jgi:Ca-activated chloride channel family protein
MGEGMGVRAVWLALFLLALPALAQAPDPTDPLLWPEPQRAFLQDGPGLLLTPDQRDRFLAMDETGREAFVRDFLAADPLPETRPNELTEGIERRTRLADSQFPSPVDVRWQLLFLLGQPLERQVIDCGVTFVPTELWHYGSDRPLVVYQPAPGEPWQLWLLIDSKRALYTSEMQYLMEQWDELRGRISGARPDLQLCKQTPEVDRVTGISGLREPQAGVDNQATPLGRMNAEGQFRRVAPEDRAAIVAAPSSLAAWAQAAARTDVPPAPARLELTDPQWDFPKRQGQRLVTRLLFGVQAGKGLGVNEEDGKKSVRLTVEGRVEHEGRGFEDLRVRYRLPPPADGQPVALLLEHPLRPDQSFLLRLKVRDEVSGAEARLTRGFAVPSRPETHLAGAVEATSRGEAVAAQVVGKDTLLLLPPPDEVLIGVWRAEALVTGERIAKVVFLVDGRQQLSRTTPPYSVEVRLASLPREQVVRVEGYDAEGALVAADEVTLNQPRGAFRVVITDPRRGSRPTGRITAKAQIIVPEERRVLKVEFKVDDKTVATLDKGPWEAPIQVPAQEDLSYLTVVATLDDGSQGEDTRFLRAPANLAEVDVQLVELYSSVLGADGHPVKGLTADDFQILESGKPQKIQKFERVENLPLNLGVVIDTSGSMASSLDEAQRAAAGFLKNILTLKDRSFALGFASRPYLLMPPTDDADAVAQSLEGLRAIGSTALHDALITGLYYFRATRGQRALVLLSDGDDTSSNASFKDTLEYARRSGVAIYPIGLGIGSLDVEVRNKLSNLAEATGGRAFFISKAEELAAVYDQIEEELRSRYLLAYDSDQAAGDEGYRPVEVKVKKRGLKVRTSRGYYP